MDKKQVVEYFRANSEQLRKKWIDTMLSKGLLKKMNPADIETESKAIYEICVTCLETGKYTGAEEYAVSRASTGVISGLTAVDFLSGMLALRDVYGRSLIERFRKEGTFEDALAVYEPVANEILLRCILAFTREKEILVRTPLEGSAEVLNEWIYALEKLAQTEDGLRTFRRIEYDARKDWFERTFGGQFKKVGTAYDACVQYRDVGHELGALRKEQFLMEPKGHAIDITLVQPCPYVKACTWCADARMSLVCLRAAPPLVAIELMSGKTYQSQLLKFDPKKACTISVLPMEREFQVAISASMGGGSIRISSADAKRLALDIVDNVRVVPASDEAAKGVSVMAFSSSSVPRGMVVVSGADALKLGLKENDSARLRKAKSG